MNAPDLTRFQPPTFSEGAAIAADMHTQRMRHDAAAYSAYSAMCAGLPDMLVCKPLDANETLADMLSEHTSNYRTDIDAPNPCALLATMLALALQRGCPAAEAYARRIALDYAVAHEVSL